MANEFVGGPNLGTATGETIFGSTYILGEPVGSPTDILDNYGQTLITNIESIPAAIQGRGGNDILIGDMYDPLSFDTEGDKIFGGDGNDTMFGDTSNVTFLYVFAGNTYDIGNDPQFSNRVAGSPDQLWGGNGNDIAYGCGGDDTIYGGTGNDVLYGGYGNDTLTGESGRDIMSSNAGRDIFDFNAVSETKRGSSRDKIMDFKRGQDHIDLKDIDAQTGVSGNQKFKFIGRKDFSDEKGELRYKDKGSTLIVQGDVNGDGKADFEIFVAVGALSRGDFVL